MTTAQKATARQYYDNGQWFKLAVLILQFGMELVRYLREYRKGKVEKI